MKRAQREFVGTLKQAILQHPQFIHVVLGPRQVGKTTGVLQLLDQFGQETTSYFSADGELTRPSSWFLEKWLETKARNKVNLMVVDEIQKVENWSEIVKQLWDEQKRDRHGSHLQLILLGSSSLHIQKGWSESLAGRYLMHPVYHWNFQESHEIFRLSLGAYLRFGGYPASYALTANLQTWLSYVRESIIEPVLGKDILSSTRVKSPALFKQCFDLACSYAVQEFSYTKLLGQLQDRGNTDLVKHYLTLFEGAFLIRQLYKFSAKRTLSRSSSPKLLPLCPALYSATLDTDMNEMEKGRAFELMIGSMLHTLPGELFYWRERNHEVDFVLRAGKRIWAIEVKWGKDGSMRGLEEFKRQFPKAILLMINRENFPTTLARLKKEIRIKG